MRGNWYIGYEGNALGTMIGKSVRCCRSFPWLWLANISVSCNRQQNVRRKLKYEFRKGSMQTDIYSLNNKQCPILQRVV